MAIKPLSQRYPAEDIEVSTEFPERNLLAAVLERAIRDILNPISPDGGSSPFGQEQNYCRAAHVWLRCRGLHPFSFAWVCQHLDLNPNFIRSEIYKRLKNGERFPTQ